MKVTTNQQAPDFKINDVYGKPVSLSDLKGKKVHLIFYRFAGCPYCNLRFHQIDKLAKLYQSNNVALISIYESSAENMLAMLADEHFYSTMIANPDSSLYQLYDLDRSYWGLFKFLLFGGGLARVMQGSKFFKKKVAQDGHTDRIEAEFLIDEKGKVVNAHYAKIQGDNLPVETIRTFIEGK